MNDFWGLWYIWIGAEWKDYKRASGSVVKGLEGLIYEERLKELNTACIDGA